MLSQSNTWGVIISNVTDGTQPTTTPGTSITPSTSSAAYPAYTEILGDTSHETYFMEVTFSGNDASTEARNTLVKLGFDFSGGTTYTDLVITDLLASCAVSMGNGGVGVSYAFPIRIPAGTAVAAAASTESATARTLSVWIKLYGKPSHRELIRYGSFVRTYGSTFASSSGTSLTPGQASEGTAVDLGTLSDDIWWWEFGYGISDSTMSARVLHADILVGDATNKRSVITNALVVTSASETMAKPSAGAFGFSVSGDHVYGRSQCSSGALDSNQSMIAYGVGG